MGKSRKPFKWHREPVNPGTYLNTDDKKKNKKNKKAYKVASDIRKFEIELYWKRTGYFWAFISVIYTAYYYVLKEIYCKHHGKIPLVVLSFLGLFFSVSWLLANKASKHWQENWEAHMDLLEDDITGPLYKTYLAEKSFSVSKINMAASVVITICSAFLLLFETCMFLYRELKILGLDFLGMTYVFTVIVIIYLVFGGFIVYSVAVAGNDESEGKVVLHRKIYEKTDKNKKNKKSIHS